MNIMSDEIKQFIEKYIDLIEGSQYFELFSALYQEHLGPKTSELSQVLLSAGLNPLEHMRFVPIGFLMGATISLDQFKIPNNITKIEARAFSSTDIKKIVIPEGVKEIETRAFSNCWDLEEVYLPSTIDFIANSVFTRCPKLHTITYNGTKADFDKVDKFDNWVSVADFHDIVLTCTDTKEVLR